MEKDIIIAKINDLKDGEMKEISVGGDKSILLVRVDGMFYAVGSKCTHFGGPLVEGTLHGHRVRCPWHQACFDIVTGNMMEPPGLDSLPHFDLRIKGEDIIVKVSEDFSAHRIGTMAKRNTSTDSRNFVIIGAGASGNAASEALRQDGFEGRVVMITKESHLPYDRTDLSKGYLKNDDKDAPIIRSEKFYADYDIEVLTNHEVVGVDTPGKRVKLSDGSSIKYDKLLLATGSVPRKLNVPGASLENIFTYRSLDDANGVKALAKKSANVVIIGASFIGMETAASIAPRGALVTVVAPESVPFENTLGSEIGRLIQKNDEANGISFRLNSKVSKFNGNGKVESVALESGEILATDMVIMGIGVQPATGFLKGMNLNPDGSLTADKNLKVGKDVYASGDIVRFIDWRSGEHIRIEHWRLAEQLGRIAAHNMAGRNVEFRSAPFFWTNQLGVNVRYVGYTAGWDEIIIQGDVPAKDFAAFYVKNGKITAVAGCGGGLRMLAASELMETDQLPTPDELRKGNVNLLERL